MNEDGEIELYEFLKRKKSTSSSRADYKKKAKDPGFKEMWKKKADDLVTASKEKKRKNKTSPSNSRPI